MKKIVPVVILATIGFATSPVAFAGDSDPTSNSTIVGRGTVDYETACKGVKYSSEHLSARHGKKYQALANECTRIKSDQAVKTAQIKVDADRVQAEVTIAAGANVVTMDRTATAETLASKAMDNGQEVTIQADGSIAIGPAPAALLALDGQSYGYGGMVNGAMMPGVTNWWNGLAYAQAYSTPDPATPSKTQTAQTGSGASATIVYPPVGGGP